jgi:hypothetical protein
MPVRRLVEGPSTQNAGHVGAQQARSPIPAFIRMRPSSSTPARLLWSPCNDRRREPLGVTTTARRHRALHGTQVRAFPGRRISPCVALHCIGEGTRAAASEETMSRFVRLSHFDGALGCGRVTVQDIEIQVISRSLPPSSATLTTQWGERTLYLKRRKARGLSPPSRTGNPRRVQAAPASSGMARSRTRPDREAMVCSACPRLSRVDLAE